MIFFMILCYRWSKDGFIPKMQNHQKIKTDSMSEALKEIDKMPKHLQPFIKKHIETYSVDKDFSYFGLFAFVSKPNEKDYQFYLNHLDDKPDFKNDFHSKLFDENTIVYQDDGFFDHIKNKMTLKEALERNLSAIYIPFSC